MDTFQHLLSLKVMRISRPELASAWEPFYSSSPPFSAHSTASITSLQGITPLSGHPKTLRDLSHASELLTLPSSFGFIQLGETFSGCLCINNEAHVDINAVSLKIEMQTATTKVVLAEFGGTNNIVAARDTFENIVHHEVKELGQHVLACSVTYQMPTDARHLSVLHDEETSHTQTFRKFYKFAVTNPLSVKTKVHIPRSPSAMLSVAERDKVFLEVHIQNLTQEPMHFERMHFDCAENWSVEDVNGLEGSDAGIAILSSKSQALMQPQDTRQLIYILKPQTSSIIPIPYAPNTVIPLGRLDLSWRTSFGEPGRLLTSTLSRKIPISTGPIRPPASALPPYMKRTTSGPPSRPQSPQSNQSRPASPLRPDSPYQNRPNSTAPPRPPSPLNALTVPSPDLEIGLIIRDSQGGTIKVDTPFRISFALGISSLTIPAMENSRRFVRLAVQHLQSPVPSLSVPQLTDISSPRLASSGMSTPSSIATASSHANPLAQTVTSPRQHVENLKAASERAECPLPPPLFGDTYTSRPTHVTYIGPSLVPLPEIELSVNSESPDRTVTVVQDFDLWYLPTQKGFTTIRGLRILLIEDQLRDEHEDVHHTLRREVGKMARTLKEWDVVAEVWVLP